MSLTAFRKVAGDAFIAEFPNGETREIKDGLQMTVPAHDGLRRATVAVQFAGGDEDAAKIAGSEQAAKSIQVLKLNWEKQRAGR